MATEPLNTAEPAAAPRRPVLQSLDDALAKLLAAVATTCAAQSETVSTFEALGRVLAEDVCSLLDVPPADNTSMDGYAMRAADVAVVGTVLPVRQRIPAGIVGQPLQPGTAVRIFTGAQVPPGADVVVMQEQCEAVAGDGLGAVRVHCVPPAGQWIRRRGEDVQRGAVVLAAGTRLTPAALGLAASVGAAMLKVARRPRVAVFSTGDELVMPGEVLPEQMRPGAIYNSNRYTLRGLVQAMGCEVQDLGIVPDRLDATRAALRAAAADCDLILTSGGVSMGEEDHLRPAVQAEGRLDLWQIAMKPGKPLAFGAVRREDGSEAWFLGLPGNPVSSFVTFLLTVRPVLLRLQGAHAESWALRHYPLRAAFDWPTPDRRREFVRARVNADGEVELFPNQSSGVLTSVVWADGLVDIAAGQAIARGEAVRFVPLSELG
ncbi:gephyrin-like molybdotransferase Glp [Sphaerotilus sp.]|uniref:molybdopterin molybdotransferase MoeA n=1 Tax=Sphaerotilus sp. TaxID=2093942 RepID=UPI0034E2DA1F